MTWNPWPGWPQPHKTEGNTDMNGSAPAPSKAKTWIALLGSLLSVAVPLIVSASAHLPEPWPAVIGGVVAVLTALGVYHAPYQTPK